MDERKNTKKDFLLYMICDKMGLWMTNTINYCLMNCLG